MLGDVSFFPDAILSNDVGSLVEAPAPPASDFIGFFDDGTIFVHDTWGAITFPVVAPPAGIGPQAVGDPCLSVILSFLKAALVTDKSVTRAWTLVNPSAPPINRTFPHDPSEIKFSSAYLPALYMWRASGSHAWAAEDWLRDTSVVTALWVSPLGSQENQSIRSPFANAITKGIADAIENGRTPSWVMPNDDDPATPTRGSLFYGYAAFEAFYLVSWKRSKLIIQSADDAPNDEYPAIEMTFTLTENLVQGLDQFALLNSSSGGSITIQDQYGNTTDAAIVISTPTEPTSFGSSIVTLISYSEITSVSPSSGPSSGGP